MKRPGVMVVEVVVIDTGDQWDVRGRWEVVGTPAMSVGAVRAAARWLEDQADELEKGAA